MNLVEITLLPSPSPMETVYFWGLGTLPSRKYCYIWANKFLSEIISFPYRKDEVELYLRSNSWGICILSERSCADLLSRLSQRYWFQSEPYIHCDKHCSYVEKLFILYCTFTFCLRIKDTINKSNQTKPNQTNIAYWWISYIWNGLLNKLQVC